jgi:predicted ATP-binding protein involved in virulence
MRIDHLNVENFKKFVSQDFDFNPHFTLLVGDNGSGKTSVLDALAVALGLWHKAAPGSGWRNILAEEIRLDPVDAGDRVFWKLALPSKITAKGIIGRSGELSWTRMIRKGGTRTTNAEAQDAEDAIIELVKSAEAQRELLPVLAYYGAGRAWKPTNKRPPGPANTGKPQQFDAYRNCLDTRIRDQDLNDWFLLEAAAANGQSKGRPGYQAAMQAILNCIPGADGLRYHPGLKQIVLSINQNEQPFFNLSAGQRMMLAMVADIAIKAVTLNSYLLGPGQPGADDPKQILERSPGVVLIDELDVHLHPQWQRRVATDLKKTFPGIQFICTSHSPQVIGEVRPEEVRLLDSGEVTTPTRTFGMDSDRVLDELMDASSRNQQVKKKLSELAAAIDREDFSQSEELLKQVENILGETDPEVTHYRTLISFLRETK